MKKPLKEDYTLKDEIGLTRHFNSNLYYEDLDKYIDYLEKSLEQHHELIKTLQTHIKIQNA